MNAQLSKRIQLLDRTVKSWLQPDNKELSKAIEATVDESLFGIDDIKHRILTLKSTLSEKNFSIWANRAGCKPNAASRKNLMCLNAGNLPMVGINDFLAIVLTGGNYIGKLSRKDPYLLPTLFTKAMETGVIDEIQYNTDLNSMDPVQADAVLFAGSQKSAYAVQQKLKKLQFTDSETPHLIRTAHYSIAWIHDAKPATFEPLSEAVLRYGGKGCRSVAIVIAPYSLKSNVCTFTDYVEQFWLYNPQHEKPPVSLQHRFAHNKAVGISQSWLDDFLIEETVEHPEENFILYWVEGGKKEVEEIIQKYGSGLQSIYSTGEYIGMRVGEKRIEPLDEAQDPPIWWQPDGVDTISWIQGAVHRD